LLFIRDFVTVKQKVSCVSVRFDDDAVADFFEDQVLLGRKPEQFARIWLHTHPGNFAQPSTTDEETFLRVFGSCQWAVMFILAQDNRSYAQLSFHVGPGGQILIPVGVDYSLPFGLTDVAAWDEEFCENVTTDDMEKLLERPAVPTTILNEFEKIPADQQMDVLEELAVRSGFWGDTQEEFL
jgi:hypothetical protein